MMHLNAKFTDVTRVHVQIRRLRAICREDLFPRLHFESEQDSLREAP